MALKRVKMFARRISPKVRLERSALAFVSPRSTRSRTSASVRPVGGVSYARSGATGWPELGGAVTMANVAEGTFAHGLRRDD
jgi:hypothetical protein